MLWRYKASANTLFKTMKSGLKKWITYEDRKYFIAIEEGEMDLILKRKEEFEQFMFSDDTKLTTNQQYAQYKNDRVLLSAVARLKGKFKDIGTTIRNKGIKAALNGRTTLEFFNYCGISITWEIINNDTMG